MASFGVTSKELDELCEARNLNQLNKIGGVAELARKLRSDLTHGIPDDAADHKKRVDEFGSNEMPSPPETTLLELIWAGLHDKTLIMLIIASIVSLIFGVWENPSHGWIEGTAILLAVVLVVMVASLNDYHKEKQFRKLNEKKNNRQIKVTRNSEQKVISLYDVLVGDVVSLETGDIICADGVFIKGEDVKCDESSMTGESMTIKKNDGQPFLLSSCQVTEGVCTFLVLSVGEHSEAGKVMKQLQTESEDTPLQEKLETLAEQIARIGLAAAVLIFILLVTKLIVLTILHNEKFTIDTIATIVKYFITSVTIVVVAVPEGLPLAVTIALAYSMMRMIKDQNLVRHLDACETMGGATTICSDKTGTLTMNQMTAMKAWVGGKSYVPISKISELSPKVSKAFFDSVIINSTAEEVHNAGKKVFLGSPSEVALLVLARNNKFEYASIRTSFNISRRYPFSSLKKSMATVVDVNDKYILHVKGASEVILARCEEYLSGEGETLPITPELRKELEKTIDSFAEDGLRTLSIASKGYPKNKQDWDDEPKDPLVFLGLVGIKDPVRPQVPGAVKQCQSAGIKVRMVTGDNIVTASKIATECGILTPDGLAIEGPDFRKKTDAEIDEILPRLQVMARSSPLDKYRLVNRLKALGEVVAVTGDGTNDAPALKEAHVGFAMGIVGTSIAKEASDIILMDDNFSSIVKAVLWGRNVYDSIRKFLQFQLTVNAVAVIVAFVGAISNEHGESPLKPVQLLWVNLIMDTMAALALATDEPTPDLLDRPPYGKNDKLITNRMSRNVLGQACYQLAVNFTILYSGHEIFNVPKDSVVHRTIIFNTFVFCQVFNELNCRRLGDELNVLYGLASNHICTGVLIFTVIFQFLIVQFGGEFAGTTPLTQQQWLACVLCGAGGLIWRVILCHLPLPLDEEHALKPVVSKSRQHWAKVREASKALGVIKKLRKPTLGVIKRSRKIETYGFGVKAK